MSKMLSMHSLLKRIHWANAVYLIATPIVALSLVPVYLYQEGFNWEVWGAFLVTCFLTNLGITAGYHRLFAHRSYEANALVRFYYLFMGATAFQGSALKWATDHRRHHRFVDTEDDPYNINQGFLYAHVGWLFIEDNPKFAHQWATDLEKDPMIRFQHRYYVPIAIFCGILLPMLIGWAMGSALCGFAVFAGLRLLLTNHSTFFINSLCHFIGSQPYTELNSARDSFIMAILACGEGYHNFHHKFQADYRNGIRWYQWDPTKWFLNLLKFVGCVRGLKRTPQSQILRARLEMDERRLVQSGVPAEKLYPFRNKIDEAQKRMRQLHADYLLLKSNVRARSKEQMRQMKADLKRAKRDFKVAVHDWMIVRKRPSLVTV